MALTCYCCRSDRDECHFLHTHFSGGCEIHDVPVMPVVWCPALFMPARDPGAPFRFKPFKANDAIGLFCLAIIGMAVARPRWR
jgi:hypothetical protein